jgi:hypothetical protein
MATNTTKKSLLGYVVISLVLFVNLVAFGTLIGLIIGHLLGL